MRATTATTLYMVGEDLGSDELKLVALELFAYHEQKREERAEAKASNDSHYRMVLQNEVRVERQLRNATNDLMRRGKFTRGGKPANLMTRTMLNRIRRLRSQLDAWNSELNVIPTPSSAPMTPDFDD